MTPWTQVVALVDGAAPDELPAVLGKLGELQAKALARLATVRLAQNSADEAALSPEVVAGRLALPPSKVYHLLRSGQLRGVKVGKYWRVAPAELAGYLRQRTIGR